MSSTATSDAVPVQKTQSCELQLLDEFRSTVSGMKVQFEELKNMVSTLVQQQAEKDATAPPTKKQKRSYTSAKGRKVQRYNTTGTILLHTYSSMGNAKEDDQFDGENKLNETSVRNAIRDFSTYKGFRWSYLDRDLADDTLMDLEATVAKSSNQRGPYAQLTEEETEILETFAEAKTILKQLGIKDMTKLCKCIKSGEIFNGSVYKLWSDCSTELQEQFLEAGGELCQPLDKKSKGLLQIDPETDEVIKTWSSRKEVVGEFNMSSKTLRDAVDSGKAVREFIWKSK